jgi:hypothetical protein
VQTTNQHAPSVPRTKPDPIRSLVLSMHDKEILRIYRKIGNPDRIERLCEWSLAKGFTDAKTGAAIGIIQFDVDVDAIRTRYGCGRYIVRVMKTRPNKQVVIRSSNVVDIRAESHVADPYLKADIANIASTASNSAKAGT